MKTPKLSPAAMAVTASALLAVAIALAYGTRARDGQATGGTDDAELAARAEARVRAACTSCHVYPSPEILPRASWPHSIRTMYRIADDEGVELPVPFAQAAAWYMLRAPDRLPPAEGRTDAGPGRVSWRHVGWRPDQAGAVEAGAGVGHVKIARLFEGPAMDLIVSDTRNDRIFLVKPYSTDEDVTVVGGVTRPGRVEVVDLEGDGELDLVVAGLGRMAPSDDSVGSVVWMRRRGPTSFEAVVLADGLGRVADTRAADITGNGRMDLAVAVFGWRTNGKLLWLENVGEQDGVPRFVHHVLDDRTGFADVRIADLDSDGRLDVVALATQQWQQVMAYWQEDDGFRAEPVYTAPHPDWGFSGLEVTDFTGDGSPDIVVTNGDGLDITVAKPQHGVGLLENVGDSRFEYRRLTSMYGAYRAVPVDLTGTGLPGLLVSAYVPPALSMGLPDPPEAILWLERVGPTQLVRRVLNADGAHHMSLDAGDMTGDGEVDFAVGWMDLGFADPQQAHTGESLRAWATLWLQDGMRSPGAGDVRADTIDWSR